MHTSMSFVVSIGFVFLVGACIGSFINLAIYRLPLNLSVVAPRSHCPTCKKSIPIFGLIPVFGFFLLQKKCFYCFTKISWRYPMIEFLSAVCSALIYIYFVDETKFVNILISRPFHMQWIIPLITALWLFYSGLVLSVIDIQHRILPDIITLPGILIGIILSTLNIKIGFINGLLGAILGFSCLFILTKLYELTRKKQGMGFGDVKYLAFIGAVVGPLGVLYTLFVASILGSVFGIGYGFVTKKGLSAQIPFGPFLSSSALLVFVALN